MRDVRRTLLRLALAACDRGDALGARPLVAAVLDMPDAPQPSRTSETPERETYDDFGRRVGVAARTVRAWIRSERIPASAVVGSGRGRRVVVAEAIAALARVVAPSSAEQAGANYVASRRRLRVVRGAS